MIVWGTGYVDKGGVWVTVWGDGLVYGSEEWDDGNKVSGDGWSSTWTVGKRYIWTGGSTTSKSVWTKWADGLYHDSTMTIWVPQCGDGLRAGSEERDDGGIVNGDGWSSTWTIQAGYIWTGGTPTTKDTWTTCTAELYPDTAKSSCVPQCGDGKRAGSEECDDGGVVSGDGWSSTWTIEAGAIWTGGTTSISDSCSICSSGLYPNTGKTLCETHWGDGKRAGSEAWDDGGTI